MRTTGANTIDRAGIAEALGFSSWETMLPLLYRDHSLATIADLTGLAVSSVKNDLVKFGVQLRQRGGRNSKKRPDTISGMARAAGIEPSVVFARIYSGKSVSAAIKLGPPDKTTTITSMAVKAGMNPITVMKRVRNGMPIQEALTKPVWRRGPHAQVR